MVACGGAQEPPPKVTPLPPVTDAAVATASTPPTVEKIAPPASDAGAARSPEMVVAAMRVDLRRCWNRALKTDPNLRATIRLTIDVAPDGSVTKVTPHATPPVPTDLEQCLVQAASKVAFDPPGGNGATFELPINLVPASP